ncbi:MAG: hypothetical protein MK052_11165 [Alphaproteobacteria bacterium]|nr:hypothetical protein [Alphaproteobacteria bacterium]
MSNASERFATQSELLINGMIEFVLTAQNAISIVIVLALFSQVILVLVGIYMRPVRTKRQFFKLLLILFSVLLICSMTVWLFFIVMNR